MIEKMHFVNIVGPLKSFDTFVIQSFIPHEIQLENAYNILHSVKGLFKFDDENPYQKLEEKVNKLGEVADVVFEYDDTAPVGIMPVHMLEPEIEGYERQIETIKHISNSLKEDLEYKIQLRNQILPIQNLDVKVNELFDFDYMKFRFGSMAIDNFKKLQDYIEAMDVIAFEVSRTDKLVYLFYFTPRTKKFNIDSLFASLYFTRIRLSNDIKGYPKQTLEQLNEEIEELTLRVEELDQQSKSYIQKHIKRIQELYTYVAQLNGTFDVRSMAVRSKDAFYMTGWVADSELSSFKAKMDVFPSVTCVFEDDDTNKNSRPPTKLRNNWFFRPFEPVVKMYGTPSYNEFDPTVFVALTYMLMFGAMFGDVGQGLVISLVGYLLYRKSQNALGQIMIYLGGASVIFGFIYGSFFGDEHLLSNTFNYTPINSMENMMQMLGSAIVLGVVLILIVMVINIRNAYKQKNIAKMLFDRNGVAGLIFYIAVLGIALSIVLKVEVHPIIILSFVVAPLILIFLAHPLDNWIQKKEHIFPEDKGSYIIEALFELVETLLAFLSNTISFMRVGAFALNHVGFFLVFKILSEMVSKTDNSINGVLVMIFGNILILVLEGLIVGIQGIRLEYYELFSRFFEGEGTEFKPFTIKKS
ncbi:MAG: hypothetical protein CVU95_14695 [Firmicutes bacterium HGW-Firmicutes-2]|nr:MAG: hypothetical protein CVU95_14695 [Firmicutes bacterium HGW-Firmicutes-2]